jgi:hypothetical protein
MLTVVRLQPKTRAGALALAATIVALGGALLLTGVILLVILAGVGAVIGAGALIYRRLTGRSSRDRLQSGADAAVGLGLDPRLEVSAPPSAPRAQLRPSAGGEPKP